MRRLPPVTDLTASIGEASTLSTRRAAHLRDEAGDRAVVGVPAAQTFRRMDWRIRAKFALHLLLITRGALDNDA
jgi:hypothetical protein